VQELIYDLGDRKLKVLAEKKNGRLWVHFAGKTYSRELPESGRRKASGAGGVSEGAIKAPMPGKITKIPFAVGDTVEPHQAVIVMEAMKMEYSLEAGVSGLVEEICCAVGDQVTAGQLLAKVEPPSSRGEA
jgi:3-methylcrotonyl-CoA carboxylase alpha subunit